MKDIKEYITESIKSGHPLYLYVTNHVTDTLTLILSNKDVEKIINTITLHSENPKKSWIDKETNKIDFTITEDAHASWELSMHIKYDIDRKKYLCDGYDDKSQKEIKSSKKLIEWDQKTIHIYNGNTYKI